jgi:hypothetical protein
MSDLPTYRWIWGCPSSFFSLTFVISAYKDDLSLTTCSDHQFTLLKWQRKLILILWILGHSCALDGVVFVDFEISSKYRIFAGINDTWMQYSDHTVQPELVHISRCSWRNISGQGNKYIGVPVLQFVSWNTCMHIISQVFW